MLTTKSLVGNGYIRGIANAIILGGLALAGSPVWAQNGGNVPPWQLPPGERAQNHSAVTEQAAYVPMEYSPESDAIQAASPSANMPESEPIPESGRIIDTDVGEQNLWTAGNCSDGGCNFWSNPFARRLWVRGEVLAMFSKSANLQPLATTSTAGTLRPQAGVLGQPTTSFLFGNGTEDPGVFPGGRFTLGCRCDPCEDSGFEVSYMFLANKSADFSTNNGVTPIIARPFFNVQTNVQDSLVIAFPGQQTGNLAISLSDEFSSLEALWRQSLVSQNCRTVDLLFGYRYGHFAEALHVASTSTFTAQVGVVPVGTISQVSDRLAANNDFQGGELGISTKKQYCRWSVELLGKFAVGNTRSVIDINGSSTITSPTGTPVTSRGGLLALPTNMGRFEENNFTVIPELGIKLGYDFTDRLKMSLGYTFLYWSRVARPGDQLDLDVNSSQLSGGTLTNNASPRFRYVPGDYWVQGFTLGLDYRF